MDTAEQMQMAFMFEEGGIADDGMNVDPVSGNEIPPGSLAKEVRDDVPAQLSEGEYVVPADVVRYYGVKFFEDLRSQAKNGLMEMEANGRIGGEPVAQTMANQTGGELTPEELAAIQQATGMAMGGMVSDFTQSNDPYAAPSMDPYSQQQSLYQGYNRGGQVLYAADGVDVNSGVDPYNPQFTAGQGSMFAPGYLIDQTVGAPTVQLVTLYGPNGEVETLTLPDQQARMNELLQAGYSSKPPTPSTETAVGQQPSGDSGPSPVPAQQAKPVDYSKMSDDQLINAAKAYNIMGTMGSVLAATMSTPLGAIVNVGVANQYNNLLDTMSARGIDVSEMKRKGSIFGGEGTLTENLRDIGGAVDANGKVIGDGKTTFGDTWLGDLLGFDGKVGVDGPGLRDSWGGARRTSGTTTTTSTDSRDSGTTTPSSQNGGSNRNVGDGGYTYNPPSSSGSSSPNLSFGSSSGSKGPRETSPGFTSSSGPSLSFSGASSSPSSNLTYTNAPSARTEAKLKDIETGKNTSGQVGFTKGGMVKRRKKK